MIIPPTMTRFRANARKLRLSQTNSEAKLWQALRNRQLEQWKFRRQHPIDRFVVDFVSIGAKLIIEVDGDTHASDDSIRHDTERTRILEGYGFEVLRVTNLDVRENLEGVMEVIQAALLLRPS